MPFHLRAALARQFPVELSLPQLLLTFLPAFVKCLLPFRRGCLASRAPVADDRSKHVVTGSPAMFADELLAE